jgi:tetratricopeptide (TPR) repeat protein
MYSTNGITDPRFMNAMEHLTVDSHMPRITCITTIIVFLLALTSCSDKSIKYYNLGVSSAELEQYDKAIEYWQQSLKHRPYDPETRYNLGLAFLQLERYEEAEAEFRIAYENNQYDHEICYGLGKSIEMQGRLLEAKNLYEKSRNLKPNFTPALNGLASVTLEMGQPRSAENYATLALSIEPMSVEGNMLLTEAYFEQGNYQAAYAQLQSSRHLASRHPQYYLLLGKITYARHMYEDAFEALGRARSLGISNADVFLYLGLTSSALEDYEEAEKYFKLAVFKDQDLLQAWRELGRTYVQTKQWDKAQDAFVTALKIDSADTESILGASYVMLNKGRFEESIKSLESLKKADDPPAMTFYYLGHAYMRSGSFPDARVSFEEFLSVWNGDIRLVEEVTDIVQSLPE